MRPVVLVLLVASLPLAGCIGNAEGQEDPFAYMRKPLYSSSFDLATVGESTDFQEFRVTDGSVVYMDVYVWVNATEGGAAVSLTNPSGKVVQTFDATREATVPVELGVWRVEVTGQGAPIGTVQVTVVRG